MIILLGSHLHPTPSFLPPIKASVCRESEIELTSCYCLGFINEINSNPKRHLPRVICRVALTTSQLCLTGGGSLFYSKSRNISRKAVQLIKEPRAQSSPQRIQTKRNRRFMFQKTVFFKILSSNQDNILKHAGQMIKSIYQNTV